MAEILGVVACFQLGKCIYEPIKRQFNYLCCFNNNVHNLRDEARKLKDTKKDLQTEVDAEENNAQVISNAVTTWLEKVNATQEKMSEIETEITTTKKGCFNLKSRYSLSRKVKKTTEAIKELRESYGEFESRKDIEEGVMASLRDNETYRVGICGMGGVGKTTMAKKIMDRAKEEHLFEELSMVVVSQNTDPLRIQKSLAESLGLKLNDESLRTRAHLLRTRLGESEKKSLIVVDDVWDNLNLEEIGIPCNSHCKVLLTSRNHDVLRTMNTEKVHAVKVLSKKEAWDLFILHVGSCIEHQNLKFIAREVIAECKGLPVALVTVGAALNGEENAGIWKDWLHQLKSKNPIGLPDILDDVYKPLRLSYEYLKNEEAKSLFLLCCLYPKDGNIPLSELAIYAIGLHMLRGIKSLEEARNRVYSLVQMLKSRFLLLEGKNKDHVKMHDVVHDVAIFIASEKKLISSDSETNDCTWISPHIGERIELQAGSTIFAPDLRLLWIDHDSRDEVLEMDNQLFEGMKELNVFSIKSPSLQQLPETTRSLVNLQTLVLESCWSLTSISFIGELVNLEILICRQCKSIESLPVEIQRLRCLRLLELSKCHKLKTIEPGIISSLKRLEELIVESGSDKWEVKNEWLNELEQLSCLSQLKIKIEDSSLATQQMTFPPNMVRFDIQIGKYYFIKSMLPKKKMQLAFPANINIGNCIVKHVGIVEEVHLKGGDGSSLDFGVAKNIKVLVFKECSTVKKLVSMKIAHVVFPLLEVLKLEKLRELKEICDMDGPMPSNFLRNLRELRLEDLPTLEHLNDVSNFNKLSIIYVHNCNRLKSLFSWSMMTRDSSLVQLKSLEIFNCGMMEQVFLLNNEENQIPLPLVFANLKSLKLKFLPKLTSFSKEIGSIEFPVLEELEVNWCPLKNFVFTTSTEGDDAIHLLCEHDKVEFNSLKTLEVDGYDGTSWCPQFPMIEIFSALSELSIINVNGVKSLFSCSVAQDLYNMKCLYIDQCPEMVRVIEDDSYSPIHVFPSLKELHLSRLPKLKSICESRCALEFPSLTVLRISKCKLMEKFTSTLLNTPKLECMYIERDDSLGINCSKERRNGTGRLVGSLVEITEEE